MKKSILILVMVLFTSQGYAGFFSSLMGSVVANDLSSSASRAYISPSRAKEINGYLWDMHKTKKYHDNYEYYLKELEHSTIIEHQDTIAWAYYDNNNTQKAIEIYEKNIMPWVRFQSHKDRKGYERTYRKFTGLKGKIDYASILQKSMLPKDHNATKKDVPNVKTLQLKLAELETKNKVLESYKTFLQKHMVLKEKNINTPDLKTLQDKLAELETKNATLESFKLLSLILGGISLLALGLVFVLLRGRKRNV